MPLLRVSDSSGVFTPVLPPELWIIVFCFVCFAEDTTRIAFPGARSRLSLVCRRWLQIVHSIPSLWQFLALDANTPVEAARACATQSKFRPIYLSFSHAERPSFYPSTPSSPNVDCARASAEALVPTSSRWNVLELWSNWPSFLNTWMTAVRSANAESLEFLTIYSTASVRTAATDPFFASPPSVFGGCLPALRRLRLFGVALRWQDKFLFTSLTHLSIVCIPSVAWPTYTQYVALFAAPPRLDSLVLKGVGCSSFPSNLLAPVALSSITQLEISFLASTPETGDLVRLLAAFAFPNLEYMSAGFHTPAIHAFADSTVLACCQSVRLSGITCCDSWLFRVLGTMNEVVDLDLRHAASLFLLALSQPISALGTLPCQKLRYITVRTELWLTLRLVVEARVDAGIPLVTRQLTGRVRTNLK
ncbi:hypothetical protein C8R44DRAFT_888662 [Mycena epipterygia]|nr:hypothetical protein C8R44DRAFT_888662 [Mycena epipterygia]